MRVRIAAGRRLRTEEGEGEEEGVGWIFPLPFG